MATFLLENFIEVLSLRDNAPVGALVYTTAKRRKVRRRGTTLINNWLKEERKNYLCTSGTGLTFGVTLSVSFTWSCVNCFDEFYVT